MVPRLVSLLDVPGVPAEIRPVLRAVILLSKGILRDQRMRRIAMLWLMGSAVVMLFLGSLLLSDTWARTHPWLYFLYWAACGWLTITGVLLALFDILLIRAAARATRRQLERQFAEKEMKGDDQ